jgi:HK97 family phage major capsid protein
MDRVYSIGQSHKRDAASGDLIVEMAFASEMPYERWWGIEVLDMKGVRLGRLNDGDGGPVLFNHNWNDLRGRHMPGSVRAEKDGVLRGQISIPQATQATRDTVALIESKTLTKASVGYQIHNIIEQTTKKSGEKIEREIDGRTFERLLKDHRQVRDGREIGGDLQAFQRALDESAGPIERAEDKPPIYRVVDWEPLENSLVTVPADPSVGVGRALESAEALPQEVRQPAAPAAPKEKATMAENQAAAGVVAENEAQNRAAAQPKQGPSAMDLEKARVRGITVMCKSNKIDDNIREHWIGTGLPMEEIAEEILQIQEKRNKDTKSVAALGLSDSEAQNFSLFKAIQATADKNWTNAGFELECSREVAKRMNKVVDPNRFYVPYEVQERQNAIRSGQTFGAGRYRGEMLGTARRDLTVGTTTAGGFLVETNNMSFIEMLRNRAVVYRMGARRLSGLVGNVTVPKQTAAATAVWLANEASTITESQQVFAQMALSPKTVGAYTEISRQLLLQSSPDAEGIVTSDLATVTSLAYDLGALSGTGASGQPTGITATAGIGSVTGTSLNFAGILEFQTDVATANVMPTQGGYVTTPAVAALMIQRVKYTSTASPLWEGNVWDGTMQGFQAYGTNQIAAASMLFGDWSQVVVAEWGVLEIEVNPYANFQAGILGVRAIVSMDVGLRYPASFSLATTIT